MRSRIGFARAATDSNGEVGAGTEGGDDREDVPFILSMRGIDRDSVSYQELTSLDNSVHGHAWKKNNSLLAILCSCCVTQWKQRFLILAGGYLFRFEGEHADKPKGIPIPVDSIIISSLPEDMKIVRMQTIRKQYIFRFETEREALTWIAALRARKQQVIKESMGHASASKADSRINMIGQHLFYQRLEREREDAARSISNPLNSVSLEATM